MELHDVAGEVLPGLWVSSMPAASWDLSRWRVGLVVTLSEHLPPQAARTFEWGTPGGAVGNGEVVYLHWPIEDGDLPDTTRTSLVVAAAVHAIRAGLTVLVHCYEGRNRSGLIAALAARQLTGCSGGDALALVRAARPGMLSNRTFAAALQQLDQLRTASPDNPGTRTAPDRPAAVERG